MHGENSYVREEDSEQRRLNIAAPILFFSNGDVSGIAALLPLVCTSSAASPLLFCERRAKNVRWAAVWQDYYALLICLYISLHLSI